MSRAFAIEVPDEDWAMDKQDVHKMHSELYYEYGIECDIKVCIYPNVKVTVDVTNNAPTDIVYELVLDYIVKAKERIKNEVSV